MSKDKKIWQEDETLGLMFHKGLRVEASSFGGDRVFIQTGEIGRDGGIARGERGFHATQDQVLELVKLLNTHLLPENKIEGLTDPWDEVEIKHGLTVARRDQERSLRTVNEIINPSGGRKFVLVDYRGNVIRNGIKRDELETFYVPFTK